MAMRAFIRPSVAALVALASVVMAPIAASGVEPLQYVTTSVRVGGTASEAASYGLDLDADGTPDNALGSLLAGLAGVLPVDASIARSLAAGDSVILHSLKTKSLDRDRSATWQTLLGVPTRNPDFTGGGSFVVDRSTPAAKKLHGRVADGRFVGGPGRIPLRLGIVPDAAPVQLLLVEGRVDATCTSDACSGKLGGGITAAQVDSVVVPALAAVMQAVVDESCSASSPDTCSPAAQRILFIFDANDDFVVTADELRANFLLSALLAPDVDLLKANGKPGRDGVPDSLSLGLGFAAVSAHITR